MNKIMDEKNSIVEIVTLTIIAGIGGAVSYLQHYLENDKFHFRHFVAQIAISAFSGGLVGYGFTKAFPDWSYVIAGVSGVFGVHILYFGYNIGLRVLGKQMDIKTSDFEHKTDSPNKK